MPAAVNLHSLKNRYLLRIYHQTAGNLLRTFFPTLARDLAALGWVAAAGALVARRLRLALAPPPGDPAPPAAHPGAAHRAAGRDRPLVFHLRENRL